MGKLIFDSQENGDTEVYRLSGTIDEQSDFASLPKPKRATLYIDLVGLEAINSVGIREWIRWMKLWPTSTKIIFQRVPRVIIEQMNLVAGFLPEGAQIDSFFVPYYCESCGSRSFLLMEHGKDYGDGIEIDPVEEIRCSNCGQTAEIDVVEAKYFGVIEEQ